MIGKRPELDDIITHGMIASTYTNSPWCNLYNAKFNLIRLIFILRIDDEKWKEL